MIYFLANNKIQDWNIKRNNYFVQKNTTLFIIYELDIENLGQEKSRIIFEN